MFRRTITPLLALLVLGALSLTGSATTLRGLAQGDDVSGKYEGIAKSEALGDIPITVDIKNANGKVTGSIGTPQGDAAITGGTYADGKVNIKFDAGGNEGTMTGTFKDGKIVGNWSLAGQTGTLELKKAGAMAKPTTAPAAPTAGGGGGEPAGEWDAKADVAGQAFPFTLKFIINGDKVTGESTSEQGTAQITKGSWSGGKLSFTLETPNGNIVMTATMKDGKLVGDLDFAGQFQGKWDASRKK